MHAVFNLQAHHDLDAYQVAHGGLHMETTLAVLLLLLLLLIVVVVVDAVA